MTGNALERVRYFRGQYLGADDLTQDQSYHIGMRRRHAIGQHIWGIVDGLTLEQQPDGAVFVAAGYAVDGLGRELTVRERRPLKLSAKALAASPHRHYLVWLEYEREQSGTRSLAPGNDRDRWRETPRLRVVASLTRPVAERVMADDCAEAPKPGELPSDDPKVTWPIFLGSLIVDPTHEDGFVIDHSGRPYAGVVASELVSPSTGTRISLGAGAGKEQFSISLGVPKDAAQEDRSPRTILRIDENGQTAFPHGIEVDGAATVGALSFSAATAEPAETGGWQIYRCAGDGGEELRIELPGVESGAAQPQSGSSEETGSAEKTEAPKNEIAIGVWSKGAFKPGLTIAEDGTVTVAGNLIVKGKVNPPAEHADGPLDPAAAAQVAELRNATAKQALGQQILGPALKADSSIGDKLKKLIKPLASKLGKGGKMPFNLVTSLLGIGNPKAAKILQPPPAATPADSQSDKTA